MHDETEGRAARIEAGVKLRCDDVSSNAFTDADWNQVEADLEVAIEKAIARGEQLERKRLAYLWLFAFGIGAFVGVALRSVYQ